MKKIMLLALGIIFLGAGVAMAQSIAVTNYPTSVNIGKNIDLSLTWKDIPLDKGYKMIVQLENWDNPNTQILAVEEIPFEKSTDSATISLKIPSNTNIGDIKDGFRFIAAVISKEKNWEDTLVSNGTKRDVVVEPILAIKSYPKTVEAGKPAEVEIAWNGAPDKETYKILVQLENWDVKPGIVISKDLTEFEPNGTAKVALDVPLDSKLVKGCRFLVTFLSKTKAWDDVYTLTTTPKDVEIK